MKKTRKSPSIIMAAMTILSFSACEDWGQMDPPAGTDVYPKLEQVANIDFEPAAKEGEAGFEPESFNYYAYEEGNIAVVEKDNDHGHVLHLPNGYARTFNPLTTYKVQNGISLTFWVKQALRIDIETEEELEPDLTGALFSFQNSNGTQRMFLTANGWLKYEGVDGEYEANNPEENKVSRNPLLLPAGEWHYMAVTVRNDGYSIYVDGKQRIDKTVLKSDFDFSKIVQFMAATSYLYIGAGSDIPTQEMWIDDIKIYRNQITDNECRMPSMEESAFEYIIGAPIITVGAEDNSAGWCSAFSNYFRIPADGQIKFKFTNHTNGVGNWNNWNLCLCTDADRGGSGYAEYFVIRSDLYGWGDSYGTGTWTNEGYGNWDAFRADMEGADVTVTIRRNKATVVVEATAKANNGNVYKETFTTTCGDGAQIVRAFFVMDGSHIVFDTQETSAFTPQPITKTAIGAEDCSTGWWQEFSDYFLIPAGQNLRLEFENHTNGAGNWNNWNLCLCTDADRGAGGYAEYFVIRSDLYGWGDSYGAGTWTNEGYGNWDAFRADMEGAQVTINILRDGAKVTTTAVATSPNGNVYKETFVTNCGDGNQPVRAFLIVDGSHLKMDSSNCYLFTPLFK
ncbi:LamG-like jellyroll fold domain-containing protein [Bacteroides heparinolyticus]|uniref:LamG-like jellyroll fold domain-containing protein n=1 Tax=Prevotella heparinolytica TaxID=28113 RepID=UPI0035A10C02